MVQLSRLDNGLTVVTDPVDTVETASIGVWVGTGTRAEIDQNNGVAHFLEHMAFKGTARRSALDIAEEIEAVGGHMNAYTSRESTAYYMKLMKEDIGLGVDMLADILQNPSFDPEELERERSVILQEIGQVEDTPDDVIYDRFQSSAFPGQSMGFATLGTPGTVRGMSRSALMGFMEEGYCAENMILVGSGKIAPGQLEDLAQDLFGNLPRGTRSRPQPSLYQGGTSIENRDSEQVHFVMGFPGFGYDTKRHYAATLLSAVLGGGMSSRLFQEIREKRGLVYSIYSFASAFSDTGIFGLYAGTGPEQIAKLVPVVCDVLMDSTETLTEAEITRAKAQLKSSTVMALESTSARAEQLGSQMLVMGRPVPIEEQIAQIEGLEASDLVNAARDIFAGKPTIAAIGPVDALEDYDAIARRLQAA